MEIIYDKLFGTKMWTANSSIKIVDVPYETDMFKMETAQSYTFAIHDLV